MKRLSILFIFLLPSILLGQSNSALHRKTVEERIQRIEHGLLPAIHIKGRPEYPMSLADRMRHYKVPGVSIAVINDYKIDWARGYGVREVGSTKPIDTATVFQAGSISKPVAGMAALYFVEHGQLCLDEDVNRKLVSWKVPANEFTKNKPITLRNLLSHSAGLTVSGFPGYAAGDPIPTLLQVLDGVKPATTPPVRVDISPGSRWRYSGGGFCVVQQLLMDIVHKPFPEIMQRVVFGPLRMTHSTYEQPLPDSRVSFAATGHDASGLPVPRKWHVYPEMAAAGLWTTPSDLATWAIEIQRSYIGQSNRVLSSTMTRQMVTRQSANWGLSLELAEEGSSALFGHAGADRGFRCQLGAFVERGQGVVIMTNGVSNDLINGILRSVAREYNWPTTWESEKTLASIDPRSYANFVGRYVVDVGRDMPTQAIVTSDSAHIFIQFAGSTREVFPQSELSFFDIESGNEYTFSRDSSGRVTKLTILSHLATISSRGWQYIGDRAP